MDVAAPSSASNRAELLATILLACAALATAWSTYQSNQWRGEQATQFSKANAARVQSSEATIRGGQLTQVDIAMFIQWLDADVGGEPQLAQFYRERFRPEFRPAFAAWLASKPRTNPDAPLSPFAMSQYQVADTADGTKLDRKASAHADAAGVANQHSNNYVLAVVLFAAALFFAGISMKLRSPRHRDVLLGLGWLLLVGTIAWIALSPVKLSV